MGSMSHSDAVSRLPFTPNMLSYGTGCYLWYSHCTWYVTGLQGFLEQIP